MAWTKSFVPSKRVVISTTQAARRSRSSIRLCGRWQWNSRTGEADLPRVAGRGHGGADGDVVRMAGEPVRPERDHHVGIELVEQLRRQLDQDLRVDVGQLAVRVVQTPRLGEPQLLPRGVELSSPWPPPGWPASPRRRRGSGRLRPWSATRRGRRPRRWRTWPACRRRRASRHRGARRSPAHEASPTSRAPSGRDARIGHLFPVATLPVRARRRWSSRQGGGVPLGEIPDVLHQLRWVAHVEGHAEHRDPDGDHLEAVAAGDQHAAAVGV